MAERTTTMTAAEYRAIREHLGLTGDDLAAILDVGERQGRRWENGATRIPAGVTRELGALVDATDAEVARLIAEHPTGRPLLTWRDEETYAADNPGTQWSARWHRGVVARVLTARPDLTIAYHDDPTG